MTQLTIQSPADANGTFYLDTSAYPFVTLTSPLTSTDAVAVAVFLPDGATAAPYPDVTGSIAGLTASVPSRVYAGGPQLVLTRSNHASAIGIYADLGSRKV